MPPLAADAGTMTLHGRTLRNRSEFAGILSLAKDRALDAADYAFHPVMRRSVALPPQDWAMAHFSTTTGTCCANATRPQYCAAANWRSVVEDDPGKRCLPWFVIETGKLQHIWECLNCAADLAAAPLLPHVRQVPLQEMQGPIGH